MFERLLARLHPEDDGATLHNFEVPTVRQTRRARTGYRGTSLPEKPYEGMRADPLPQLEIQPYGSNAIFVRKHGLPPSSPRSCPHPHLVKFRSASTPHPGPWKRLWVIFMSRLSMFSAGSTTGFVGSPARGRFSVRRIRPPRV